MAKICHRDLKPDNIQVKFNSDTNEVSDLVIIDFGISVDLKSGKQMTGKCGVKKYSAPETRNWSEYDQAIDIWSVGCLITFMLSGKQPSKKSPI